MCVDISKDDPFAHPWIARSTFEDSLVSEKDSQPTPSSHFQIVEDSTHSQKLTRDNVKQMSDTQNKPVLKEVISKSNRGSQLGSYAKNPTEASSRTPTKIFKARKNTIEINESTPSVSACSKCSNDVRSR